MQPVSWPGNSRIGGDFPGDGGPWESNGKVLPGEMPLPIPPSPKEMPWALLINHLLSIYYVPTILYLSLHLASSITLFTGTFPCLESTQLGTGLKVQGSRGAVEQV